MKKEKVILITAAAVGLIIGGIIGLSEIFKTSWQQPEQVDNSLNVDIDNAGTEGAFNYPYVKYTELDDTEKEKYYDYFYPVSETFIPQKNDSFTYQDAVNLMGESIKYLTGYTEHQKSVTVVELLDKPQYSTLPDRDADFYKCCQIVENSSEKLILGATIDESTGEIWRLHFEDGFHGSFRRSNDISAKMSDELLATARQYFEVLGINDVLTEYEFQIQGTSEAPEKYILYFKTDTDNTLVLTLNMDYSFYNFSRMQYVVLMDYKKTA